METIATPRLRIRRFAETDLADYLTYQSLPEVRQFMPGNPHTEEESIRFLNRQAAMDPAERGQYHAYAVFHVEDRRVIGDVGVYLHQDKPEEGDVGFQFHPDYHGQGYASEAVRALIDYLFQDLGLKRVTSGCDAQNTASYALMERLGMHPTTVNEEGRAYELLKPV